MFTAEELDELRRADALDRKDNRDRNIAERNAAYRAANKDKIADYQAAYYAANKDKRREYMRDYMRKRRAAKKAPPAGEEVR